MGNELVDHIIHETGPLSAISYYFGGDLGGDHCFEAHSDRFGLCEHVSVTAPVGSTGASGH